MKGDAAIGSFSTARFMCVAMLLQCNLLRLPADSLSDGGLAYIGARLEPISLTVRPQIVSPSGLARYNIPDVLMLAWQAAALKHNTVAVSDTSIWPSLDCRCGLILLSL